MSFAFSFGAFNPMDDITLAYDNLTGNVRLNNNNRSNRNHNNMHGNLNSNMNQFPLFIFNYDLFDDSENIQHQHEPVNNSGNNFFDDFFRQAFNPQNQQVKGHPASLKAIKNLKRDKIKNYNITCSVCQDDFEMNAEYIKLPCHHIYHEDCILPWFKEHNSCPTCRYEIETEDNEYNKKVVYKQPPPPNIPLNNNSVIDEFADYKRAVLEFANKLKDAECALSVIRGEPCILHHLSDDEENNELEDHSKIENPPNDTFVEEEPYEPLPPPEVKSTSYYVPASRMNFSDYRFRLPTAENIPQNRPPAPPVIKATFSPTSKRIPTCKLSCQHSFHTECLYEYQRLHCSKVVVGNATLGGNNFLICPVCKVVTIVDDKDLKLHQSRIEFEDKEEIYPKLNPTRKLSVKHTIENEIAEFSRMYPLIEDKMDIDNLESSESSIINCELNKSSNCNSKPHSELLKLKNCSHILHENCILSYQRDLALIKKGRLLPVLVCPVCRSQSPNSWDLVV